MKPLTGAGFNQYTVQNIVLKRAIKHLPPLPSVRILDQLRKQIRSLHYSLRTEEVRVYWASSFIRFHGLRHPGEMGKAEIEALLMALVSTRNVSSFMHRRTGRHCVSAAWPSSS